MERDIDEGHQIQSKNTPGVTLVVCLIVTQSSKLLLIRSSAFVGLTAFPDLTRSAGSRRH